MDKKQELIKQCRYYSGQEQNPFILELEKYEVDKSHLPPPECMHTEYRGISQDALRKLQASVHFWEYERIWVDFHTTDNALLQRLENEYREFVLPKFSVEDSVPMSLKGLLFDRFVHRGGSIDSFKEWYSNY